MVVVMRELRERYVARKIIMSLEVPEEVLLQSEQANDEPDWVGVVYALDRVFLSHGGAMGQCRFLNERSNVLDGKTPIEVLALRGGPMRFCRAAGVFADTAA
jgi:hypothetical protein